MALWIYSCYLKDLCQHINEGLIQDSLYCYQNATFSGWNVDVLYMFCVPCSGAKWDATYFLSFYTVCSRHQLFIIRETLVLCYIVFLCISVYVSKLLDTQVFHRTTLKICCEALFCCWCNYDNTRTSVLTCGQSCRCWGWVLFKFYLQAWLQTPTMSVTYCLIGTLVLFATPVSWAKLWWHQHWPPITLNVSYQLIHCVLQTHLVSSCPEMLLLY